MKKFRIKPYDNPYLKRYIIQKRVLGVFWLDVTGAATFEEAERLVKSMLKDKKPITYY